MEITVREALEEARKEKALLTSFTLNFIIM